MKLPTLLDPIDLHDFAADYNLGLVKESPYEVFRVKKHKSPVEWLQLFSPPSSAIRVELLLATLPNFFNPSPLLDEDDKLTTLSELLL